MADKVVEEGKVCARTAYLVIGIIWYLVDEKMKKNSFARFHVKQSLVLIIASVIVSIVEIILTMVLSIIPGIGYVLGSLISVLLNLTILVLWIIVLLNAVNGKEKELPVIGSYANSLNL